MRTSLPIVLALSALAGGCSSKSPSKPSGGGGGDLAVGDGSSSAGAHDLAVGAAPYDGGPPPGFWDNSNLPTAKNVMMFKFLNRTNGKFQDSEVYWSFKSGSISETHSIAAQPTYDMPANSSGRMYFYICAATDTTCAADPTKSKYYDFIEHTIGPAQYNGNTTRVDAWGLKIAMNLHCTDGFDVAVGEDYATFLEDRDATFARFIAEVPAEFQPLAQMQAPYRIVNPGSGGFDTGGTQANYYSAYIDQIWSANGLTIPKAGANGDGLTAYPDISAAIYRHVGGVAGSFSPAGKLMNQDLWKDPTTFYTTAPADYYARFWHAHGLNGKAYGFPYDDVGGYSSYVSHSNPQYMLVAIGF
jgi:Beta-1,3-glucanase